MGVTPLPLSFAKSSIYARYAFSISQNSHNKGVIYQNRHNKGLNPKIESFRPVFAGKIVQIKELWVVKELSPGLFRGFPCLVLFYEMEQN
jgi:hypothetical protein